MLFDNRFEWFDLYLMFDIYLMFLNFEWLLMMWYNMFVILSLVINSFSRLNKCFFNLRL